MSYISAPSPIKAPSRGWYLLAAAIFILGAVAAGFFVAWQLPKLGDKLSQILVPGEADLRLTERGTYTIFHERTSVVDGRVYSSDNISGLRVALRSERGEPVTLSRPATTSTYSFAGRTGVGIFTFEIAQPGTYRLSGAYDDGRTEPRAVLAVGEGFVGALLAIIFGALGLAFTALLIAIIIAAVTFTKRRRARRAAMTPAPWPPAGPGWPPPR